MFPLAVRHLIGSRLRLSPPQWFLIKQQAYKVSLAGSLFFAGLLVGNVVFGPLSDKVGRRPVYLSGERPCQVTLVQASSWQTDGEQRVCSCRSVPGGGLWLHDRHGAQL